MDEQVGVTAAARLSGVSVRTLQFYDRSGVLVAARDEAGRRVYGPAELLRLHEIRLLTGSGVPLAEVGKVLAARPDRPWGAVLAEQAVRLEIRELILRGQRTVVAALADVLDDHPAAAVPATAVAALTNTETTLLGYPAATHDLKSAELTEAQVQQVLSTYFAWKACAVQALVLAGHGIGPDTGSGRALGARYVALRTGLETGAPELVELHLTGAATADRWPAADRHLHTSTEEYLHRCEAAHLSQAHLRHAPADDGE